MSQEKGEENVRKLAAWLESVDAIPARGDKANWTEIANAIGVRRETLYKNQRCCDMLKKAIAEKGLRGIEPHAEHDPNRVLLERKITDLERKNSDLYAQVQQLRRQIQKYKHIEEMYQQGRRVIL